MSNTNLDSASHVDIAGFALVMATSVLVVSYLLKSIFPAFPIGIVDILALFFLCLFFRMHKVAVFYKVIFPYFLFILFLLLSTAFYSSGYAVSLGAVFTQLLVYLKVLFLCGAVVSLVSTKSEYVSNFLLILVKLILIGCFLLVILQHFFPSVVAGIFKGMVLDTYVEGTSFRRLTGIFYHPTPLSFFSAFSIIYLASRYDVDRLHVIPYLLIALFLMVASGQRGEFFFLFVSILISYFGFKYFSLLLKYKYVIGGLASLLLYFGFEWVLNGYDLDASAIARMALYSGALDLASNHFPLGSGAATFGSFNSYDSMAYYDLGFEKYWWYRAEENYLTDTFWAMVLAEAGALGCAFYFVFLVGLFNYLRVSVGLGRYGFMGVIFLMLETLTNPIFTGASFLSLMAFMFIIYSNGDKDESNASNKW